MQHLLDEIDFRDRSRAISEFRHISAALPPAIGSQMQFLLAWSPDPDAALHYLESLAKQHPDAFQRIATTSSGLHYLITVFSYSRFLSDEVLKNPGWMEALLSSRDMHRVLSSDEFVEQLEAEIPFGVPPAVNLAVFRRRQILRILIRDLLPLGTLAEATEELSNLADAILHFTCRRLREELERRHGAPRLAAEDGSAGAAACEFSILALGKLGGRELNYSSDIDLMFLYGGSGQTDGADPISNKEFYKKIANQLTDLLSTYTAEGICYRVDLRLRPDGRLGEVAVSLDGAKAYYQTRARDWELQMLIKARVAAGDQRLGKELLSFVEPKTYSTTLDFSAVESMSVTRERINEKLAARRNGSEFDVKLARGGIRDIEFLVQCLQRMHGGRERWVRHGGTLLALLRLRDKNLLDPSEYSRLATAYQFLRNVEHRLQFADDRQTHALPSSPEELALLARKMPAEYLGSTPSADKLLARLNAHLEIVQEIYERVIHAQKPIYYTVPAAAPLSGLAVREAPPSVNSRFGEPAASNLIRFLDTKAPSLAQMIARGDLKRGHVLFEHFLEAVVQKPEWLGWLDSDPVLSGYVIDLFARSPHFAELLIRRPDLLSEIRNMRERPNREPKYAQAAGMLVDAVDLRRFFRREMLRLQSESICLQLPVFTTLERTSDLADAAIAAAYRLSVEHVMVHNPSLVGAYEPRDQLMVIALGRLGMREFDLASDADLVFVLPKEDSAQTLFWTRVAERLIELVTAYTIEGVIFAIDTRLRPNGREGALVQSESAFRDYFDRHAEAWESIAYMKARCVAGNNERSEKFLNELQELDWRRYGQSGRSRRQLLQMRQRLEKEQGPGNPLKAGAGGFYDIDFALMYLRLKSAGIFFKVLNTPARIDIIEKMGHLERNDATFLRDAVTFYRALDHGLRLVTGQAAGELPETPSETEMVTELVSRWTPDHLHDQPLAVELTQIQTHTRDFFNRVFGE